MSLAATFDCRAALLASLEKLFAPHSNVPYPSQIYIYGNENTGKLTMIKHALKTHHHSVIALDCREIYSLNMFYQIFLTSFRSTTNISIPTVKNFNDFIRILRQISIEESDGKKKKFKSHHFVLIHHIELLLNFDTSGHLLYLLFKLNELTLGHFNSTLILIGHQPFHQLPQMNQIEAELGVLNPISIFVPAYTRAEIVTILQQTLTRKQKIRETRSISSFFFIECFSSSSRTTRFLTERSFRSNSDHH